MYVKVCSSIPFFILIIIPFVPSMSGLRDLLLMVKMGVVRISSFITRVSRAIEIFQNNRRLSFGTIRQIEMFDGAFIF